LFESLLRDKGIKSDPAGSIRRYTGSEPVRLTHQQEGMWFLEQMHPEQSVYNVPCCLRLRGNLDAKAFEQALAAIVDRHDALRTCCRLRENVPVLHVLPPGQFRVVRINFSSLPVAEAEQQALFVAAEECRTPFDLVNGPLIRAVMIKLATSDHVMIVVTHHLLTDGWSMGIFLRELSAHYESFSRGEAPELAAPEISYTDYAAWYREWLSGSNLEELRTFWRRQLDGCQDLELPRDHDRSAESAHQGAHAAVLLSAEATNRVREFSSRAKVTRFTTLIAAFRCMLFSYNRQEDQVVGSPLACRNRRELEAMVGYFVNVLPFRGDLSGNPTFGELVEREALVAGGVYEHQDMPFAKLVQDLELTRRDGANPVYQVQFTLLEPRHSPDLLGYGLNIDPDERQMIGNLQASPLPIDNAVSKFDLAFLLWDRPDKIVGTCEYDTQLFAPATIEEMIGRLKEIVDIVTTNPDIQLSQLAGRFPRREKSAMVTSTKPEAEADRSTAGPRKRKRQTVTLDSREWVNIEPLFEDSEIPLQIRPKMPGVDLAEWAAAQSDFIDALLLRSRALLFRGFSDVTVDVFEKFVMSTSDRQLLEYKDRTTPRETKGNRVYTSTVHPQNERINAHNEGTYWIRWPLRLFFCCQVASPEGGETPISDVRKVYRRLRPEVVERFAKKQMMLVRNFNDGFGLPWQEVFQTEDRAEVEAYCKANKIEFEWKDRDRLRTRQTRPAIRTHPVTGEPVWFNHAAFFHHTTLEPDLRKSLIDELGIDGLPYSTCYGDGSPIEADVAEEIRQAYAAETVKFRWETGDVLLLDNMSISHAREPYKGPRDIIVCMTNVHDGSESYATAKGM
jgi:alpha-ketoglutarate-dependent taurine dioxygenase